MKEFNRVIYATDLDGTLIYSMNRIGKIPFDGEYTQVEEDGDFKSYMSNDVREKLVELNNREEVTFIPITTRSVDEYNRIDLGLVPEYAVVANGGRILHNGKEMVTWTEYVNNEMNGAEALRISLDLAEMESVKPRSIRFRDNCFFFCKTLDGEKFDIECKELIETYTNWTFTRQRDKVYIIPNHVSKQIALQWLQKRLGECVTVVSGDTLLDVPMLAIADKAVIPEHSELFTDGVVETATKARGGIRSPLDTMEYVEKYADTAKEKMAK